MKQLGALTVFLLSLSYPFIFYFGREHFEFRSLLIFFAIPLLFRFVGLKKPSLKSLLILLLILLVFGFLHIQNNPQFFMFTPVLINLGLLWTFGSSLFTETCLVERFARMQSPELSLEQLAYCKRVNVLWCGIFIFNGSVALYIALINDLFLWTLYNGILGYVVIGLFGGAEYIYRHWRFRHYTGSITDPFFKKIFPEK
ncbi:MAG: hypothetical protein QNL04_15470 [SAR324 cluster bacterium]|nr:hypothetical protein [SAR324 cluster bacterium]